MDENVNNNSEQLDEAARTRKAREHFLDCASLVYKSFTCLEDRQKAEEYFDKHLCPPNGMGVVYSPGNKNKRGSEVAVGMCILCVALACPMETRLGRAMRDVSKCVMGMQWTRVVADWMRGVRGVGETRAWLPRFT